MERMNGEKTMRGLKKQDTKILAGYQIFTTISGNIQA
jgi:hypothetical protein